MAGFTICYLCTQPTLPLHQVSFDMMKKYLLILIEMVKWDLIKHVLTHQWALRGLFYFTEILFDLAAAQIFLPVYWIPRYILKQLASKRLPAICCSSTVPSVPLLLGVTAALCVGFDVEVVLDPEASRGQCHVRQPGGEPWGG